MGRLVAVGLLGYAQGALTMAHVGSCHHTDADWLRLVESGSYMDTV